MVINKKRVSVFGATKGKSREEYKQGWRPSQAPFLFFRRGGPRHYLALPAPVLVTPILPGVPLLERGEKVKVGFAERVERFLRFVDCGAGSRARVQPGPGIQKRLAASSSPTFLVFCVRPNERLSVSERSWNPDEAPGPRRTGLIQFQGRHSLLRRDEALQEALLIKNRSVRGAVRWKVKAPFPGRDAGRCLFLPKRTNVVVKAFCSPESVLSDPGAQYLRE